ncbi:MAG TPA: hypothetical protein VHI93_07665 [Candidatus Thermoplasmatota archaeon]|nr:hypothetical protein [Candidatus Thermoplasmatota archaeon]
MTERLLPVLAALSTALLAGCAGGDSVTIAGQGYMTGTQTKTLSCGTSATLTLGAQGGGSLTVKVTDGAGAQVYSQSVGSGQDGSHQDLSGKEGTWTLIVSTGVGYGGQYGIILAC